MHGFKRGTGCGPLRITLAWAEAMKNWSWDRIRYVISPSHYVFGELQINALRAEVPLMPDTYWTYGRQPGNYPEIGSWGAKDEVLAESSRPSVALHRAIALASNSSRRKCWIMPGVAQLWTGLLARDLVGYNLLRHC